MSKEERLSLESNDEDAKFQRERRGGVKLNSSKSMFAKDPVQIPQKETFEKQADEFFEETQDRKQQAVELVQQFWSFVKDETLVSNKGPVKKNLEKEIVSKLLNFASEMNNDPKEPEGAGSVAVITLLLKAVLYLRDCNNDLGYRLAKLERGQKNMSDMEQIKNVKPSR